MQLSFVAASSDIHILGQPARDNVLWLGILLAILQILDAGLTASGVAAFGLDAEGNILVRSLMETFGVLPALVSLKAVSIVAIAVLCSMAATITWIQPALRFVAAAYIILAIVPWTIIHLQFVL